MSRFSKKDGLSKNKSVFRNIVTNLLKEAKEPEKESGEDSIDDQIDRYFSNYEAEAKNSKNEGLDFRSITRRFLIEAEEDESAEDKKADKKGDEAEEVEKLTSEDIDIETFSNSVVRLVDNHESLLEVKNTILRRAVNFLNKNYEKDVADAFKEQLLESFGIEIGQSEAEKQDEYQPPKAAAAGPMGGST